MHVQNQREYSRLNGLVLHLEQQVRMAVIVLLFYLTVQLERVLDERDGQLQDMRRIAEDGYKVFRGD